MSRFPDNDAAYDDAAAVLDRLAVLPERTADQEDYLETLSAFVERYDQEHYAADLSGLSPADTLRYLCEQNNLTASALGELLGNRSLGSKLLRGERQGATVRRDPNRPGEASCRDQTVPRRWLDGRPQHPGFVSREQQEHRRQGE